MGISQAALSYLGQFNKRNNLSVNLPHVGEFWVGMSVFDIKSQLDQADRKCYLKRKTESTYTLCDTFDQELLILGIRSMVETITCKDMENYLNADVKAFGAYAVNGASTLLSSNTLKGGKASQSAVNVDASEFEPYKATTRNDAMKRAEAFKLIQTKPETDPNEQKRFLNNAPNHGAKSKIESKIQNISLRMQELKEQISKPNEDRLRIQAELNRAKESRTKALNSLYQNKVPVPKGVWTLQDCVDNGFVLTDEKGLPFPNTEKERYVTGRVYDWRPNTPGINSRPLDEEEQRAFFKALDEAGISKSDFYIGGVYGGCRFTVTEDDHVPNIGIREFVEESSVLANDCRNFPRVMSLLNKPAVKDSIAIIKDMDLGIAEIRGRLSAADAACDSDVIEAARQEYNMLKNERHSLERERDCFDQEAFDDFAKAVGQIDNTSEKSL